MDFTQALKTLRQSKEYIMSTKSEASNCLLAVHMYGMNLLSGQSTAEALEICSLLQADDPSVAIEKIVPPVMPLCGSFGI